MKEVNSMSIEKLRSSLNSDDLKTFNDIMYRIHLCDDVNHDIIGFDDVNNFIIKSNSSEYCIFNSLLILIARHLKSLI